MFLVPSGSVGAIGIAVVWWVVFGRVVVFASGVKIFTSRCGDVTSALPPEFFGWACVGVPK